MDKVQYFQNNKSLTGSVIVDLRSPKEYRLGHVPGAVNVPLFDDEERHEVGFTYKQVGRLEAIQLGLEIVAKKVEALLGELEGLCSGGKGLVLYCWRGGMRSNSVAKLLDSMSIDVSILDGGYKSYRRQVLDLISQVSEKRFIVLMGRTGVGKSEVLRQATDMGTLDFEAYANHRGSAFGDLNQRQQTSTQQNFENVLAEDLFRLRNEKTFLVEIENYFGEINVPKNLREKMLSSPIIVLKRARESRIKHILNDYVSDWDTELCSEVCARVQMALGKYFSVQTVESLQEKVRQFRLDEVVGTLLDIRYDPLYDKKLKKHRDRVLTEIDVTHGYQGVHRFLNTHLG